jgi:mannose-6-phosphate isomerase-like protein (cupin superfamily)
MKVESWDVKRDGPLSEAALRQKLERRGYRVSRYVYSPGTYFPDHSHHVDKIDAVLSGSFRMKMGNEEVILEAGDCLAVPRDAVHSAEVVGNEPVVSLDATKGEPRP